jgi:hypothetical protein
MAWVDTDFQVRRDDLHQCRWTEAPPLTPAEGQAVLRIEAFGFSANNITYASLGDSLGYWRFFPAPAGWGRIPVWGFATVLASRHAGLQEGARVYGYLPPSSQLLVVPERIRAEGFADASPHRAALPPAYNRYTLMQGTPGYDPAAEDAYMVLRPLFFLSFMLEDFLRTQAYAGAQRLLVTSASSKAALGLAHLLAGRGGIETVGLTSAQRVGELQRLGVYTRVVGYDGLDALEPRDCACVDLSGSAALRAAIHARHPERLKLSLTAGATHWQAPQADPDLPGPKPLFFFVPDHIVRRTREWGRAVLDERFAQAWQPFLEWAQTWLTIRRHSGCGAVERAYREVLEGRTRFDVAHVFIPGTASE